MTDISPHEPTIRDVAKRAGVSIGTVSRVLNKAADVRPPMREAVERAIQELNYQPNESARQLRSMRTRAIGMVVNDLLHGMNVVAARGAEEAAESRGYTLLLADSRQDAAFEQRIIESLLSRRVDGLLVTPARSIAAVQTAVARSQTPLLVYGQLQSRRDVPTAIIEEREASLAAIEALIACGHRRILLTGQDQPVSRNRVRHLTSLFHAATDDEVRIESRLVPNSEAGVAAVREGLASDLRPTAVVSLTLTALPYVCRGIREEGLTVPADISVLTYGDADWVEGYTPPISVVTLNYREHLQDATHYLIDLIEGEAPVEPQPTAHSEFVPRESIGPAKN